MRTGKTAIGWRPRPGFSLAELLVSIAVGSLVLLLLYRVLGGGMRSFTGTQQRLQAVQVAQMALEIVENDVRTLMLKDADDPAFFADPTPRDRLTLVSTEQGAGGAGDSLFRGVVAMFGLEPTAQPDVFFLTRNGVAYRSITLGRLTFRPRVAGPPDRQRHFLEIFVTAVDTFGKKTFSLCSLLALDEMDRWRQARHWQLNPDAGLVRTVP